jgi:hypothetical protein
MVGVIGFGTFGLVQASIVKVFSKFIDYVAGCSLFILIGILGISGFILGMVSFWGMSLIPKGSWQQLEPPPENVIEIMDEGVFNFWGGIISVRTISNRILLYQCVGELPCGWLEPDPNEPDIDTPNEICTLDRQGKRFPAPLAPGKVVSSRIFDVCGADYTIQYNFILLENGTIWEWDRYWSVYEILLFYPFMGFVGMIVSIISGFAIRDKKYQGIYV